MVYSDNMAFFVQRYSDIMCWLMTHKAYLPLTSHDFLQNNKISTNSLHQSTGKGLESWSQPIPLSTVLNLTSTIPNFPDVANRLIRCTPADGIIDWEIMWRDPRSNWVSPGSGRVVQVGDSAHTFLPSSGSGATQAMEDAISLATCLQIGGKENVSVATRVHNKLR